MKRSLSADQVVCVPTNRDGRALEKPIAQFHALRSCFALHHPVGDVAESSARNGVEADRYAFFEHSLRPATDLPPNTRSLSLEVIRECQFLPDTIHHCSDPHGAGGDIKVLQELLAVAAALDFDLACGVESCFRRKPHGPSHDPRTYRKLRRCLGPFASHHQPCRTLSERSADATRGNAHGYERKHLDACFRKSLPTDDVGSFFEESDRVRIASKFVESHFGSIESIVAELPFAPFAILWIVVVLVEFINLGMPFADDEPNLAADRVERGLQALKLAVKVCG